MVERIDADGVDHVVLMQLLEEPLLNGPTGYTLYEVAKMISQKQLDQTCYVLHEQTMHNQEAIDFCRSK